MTLNQLQTLTEEELALALVIVNVIDPPGIPKMEFEPRHLTWFRHDALIQKFLQVFNRLLPEGHATFISLMFKLGVKIEIQQVSAPETSSICPTPQPEITSSTEPLPNTNSGSVGT